MNAWIGRAVILSFWVFSAWYLYIGGMLTAKLVFLDALIAIAIANLVFVFLFTFYAGQNKPKDVLFQEAFGSSAARYLIALLPTLTQIGWYAVVVEIGGTALALFLGTQKHTALFYSVILVYGFLTIWFAVGGLRRIGKLSYISTPAMLGFIVWGAYGIFNHLGSAGLFAYTPNKPGSITDGVQLAIASFISAAVVMPDFLHDLGSKKNIFLASFWGLIPTTLLVGGMGAAFAIVGKSYDVIATLQLMNGPLLVYALLSIDNLCGAQAVFPVGIGLASVMSGNGKQQESDRKFWTVVGGAVSIVLAMIGVVGKLEIWLSILGTVFSPILGVVLANQYLVKGNYASRKLYVPALTAWAVGCLMPLFTATVPIIQSTIVAFVVFSILAKWGNKESAT